MRDLPKIENICDLKTYSRQISSLSVWVCWFDAGFKKCSSGEKFRGDEMSFEPVSHVIFDMDGLLINTEDLYTDAFQAVLDEFDVQYTFEMKAKIMGSKPAEWSRFLVELMAWSDKISPEEFIAKCEAQYPIFFPRAQLLPGVSSFC